jgi:hypothetical protein
MKRALGIAIVLGLVAAPAFAQKITIDYARDFDFDAVTTFTYVDTDESNAQNPMMHERIVSMIKAKLTRGGLTEVSENPDLFVTYHLTTEQQTTYSTTSFGYGGYWGGWGGYGRYGYGGPGMASSTTTAHNYTEGTLIIDIYDAVEKKMVVRGTGTVTVKDQPEKQVKQVETILEKMGKKWQKIIAGKGK